VECTRACLDPKAMLASTTFGACGPPNTLGLAPLEIPILALCDLAHIQMTVTINYCNAWGAKCIVIHDHEYPTYLNSSKLFNNLSLIFLIH
jgi:hypothetical protein